MTVSRQIDHPEQYAQRLKFPVTFGNYYCSIKSASPWFTQEFVDHCKNLNYRVLVKIKQHHAVICWWL